MKYFWDEYSSIEKSVDASKAIHLFFDYDGTLTPIKNTPKEAYLHIRVKKLINKLIKIKKIKLSIISGRELADVKNLAGIKNIYYAGNHGLEIKGPGMNFVHPKCIKSKKVIKDIYNKLKLELVNIKGVVVEYKALTLSVHYRMADVKDIKTIKKLFTKIIEPNTIKNQVLITQGKKVFEIRPPIKWNKGHAVKKITNHNKVTGANLSIFVGDDVTDEDAFKILKNKDLSVFVGKKKKTSAKYYLKDTNDVKKLLRFFINKSSVKIKNEG
ncbi:trehalose-phosphatase [bacterium]